MSTNQRSESKKIVLASNNPGKITELNQSLINTKIDFVAQSEFNIPEAEETGLTFVENAIIKARHACEHSGMSALADDSGLVVPALNDEPGVFSARYANKNKQWDNNIDKLLAQMKNTPQDQRHAYLVCILAYMRHPNDPIPMIFQGIWEGEISTAAIGDNGFGYDSVFFVHQTQCTAAQMSPEIKNQLSHRAQAIQNFKKFLLSS